MRADGEAVFSCQVPTQNRSKQILLNSFIERKDISAQVPFVLLSGILLHKNKNLNCLGTVRAVS